VNRKLHSETGEAINALRKTVLESVFGLIKESRRLDRLGFRGLEQEVMGEWGPMATTHNLLKLFGASLGVA
jgi:hypothetical protein